MKIGVVGCGFVGKATMTLRNPEVQVVAHDKNPSCCDPPGTSLEDAVVASDLVFVSVPTPMVVGTGEVDLSIVEAVVAAIREVDPAALIVMRSTVPPGTCERLGVHFMPEFLTEASAAEDFRRNPVWMVGAPAERGRAAAGGVREALQRMLASARTHNCIESDRLEWMDATEAELVKYFRNTYLAVKVSYCNEFASLCDRLGVCYDGVRVHAASDPRIGVSHTAVPGPDGRRGFGGTCFPKDIHGLQTQFRQHHVQCPVLDASIDRNEKIDRPGRDWLDDLGRAVSERQPDPSKDHNQ